MTLQLLLKYLCKVFVYRDATVTIINTLVAVAMAFICQLGTMSIISNQPFCDQLCVYDA